ncbi:hypothetical protein [Peribacillus asahii]|uniref:hypothetical protein n=1 Tax=Peribacillus asahii TaxID=228899 RepID=UPI00207A8430|nr:hypothetical protein [Peribacillus asahii]USK72656.1 hypothetical protein LIS76_23310 [Peribacillus asahii]USK72693.1 hypothetical protein LIS76_23890 [Peribacillus asahii]
MKRVIRKMYFVHDLLFAEKEEAHKFDDGKPYLVREVFVGCEERDMDCKELDPYEYSGWMYSDVDVLKEQISLDEA